MSIDTSRTIEVEASWVKIAFAGIVCLLFAALGAAIAVGYLPADRHVRWIGWVILIFFGLCSLLALYRLVNERGAVVTMSRDGIRDIRVAAEVIPWRAITDISTWQFKQQRIVMLAVDPAVQRTLTLSRTARWSRGANAALGAKGLAISPQGLKIGQAALLATAMGYWRACGRGPRAA